MFVELLIAGAVIGALAFGGGVLVGRNNKPLVEKVAEAVKVKLEKKE